MITDTKKVIKPIILLLCLAVTFTIQSCKKSRSDMGKTLFQQTKNKVFKDVTPEGFEPVFKKMLADEREKLDNPQTITAFYEQNGYDPIFVMDHIINGELNASYFQMAGDHGLEPQLFKAQEIDALIKKVDDKKGIKTLDEAYRAIAELELLTANSLIKYSNAMKYGILNPKKIYARYYIETKRPDSSDMSAVFKAGNLKNYLDSIQPKDVNYTTLQKALKAGVQAPGMSKEESKRLFMVNLERLRWKNKPTEKKYVSVNIADYMLNVMEDGKSVISMKVCVGEGRNKEDIKSLINYDNNDAVDQPFSHETPQLNSMIHSVDVNPIWNIPKSIATKEIMVEAAKDRYYLSNKNIRVYKNGDEIDDPDEIDWASAPKDGTYEFKQRPGDENALGKIKFLFNNQSSVYLHDTPAKLAFEKKMRAVSHGCVRVGDPNGLALNLFGEGKKYNIIDEKMSEDNPAPTTVSLSPKIPVYLTYVTAWAENGKVEVRKDVYGLDIVLYANLQKLMD
jgi:murein L,D-transpeptidase YcbB/YkuD